MTKIKYCLSTKKKDLCKRNLQTETSFDASCLQCMEDIAGEHIDTDNEYMYYYSVEFIK